MMRVGLSIRAKLLLAMMSTSLAGLLFVGTVLLANQHRRAGERLGHEMARIGDIVAANNLAALQFADADAARRSLAMLAVDERVLSAVIYDVRRQPLAAFGRTAAPLPLPSESPYERDGSLVVSRPMLLDGERIGTLTLRADLAAVSRIVNEDARMLVGLTAVAAALALLVALFLGRVMAAPLLHLAAQAQLVSKHADYSIRVQPRSHDEVGTLYRQFNEMLEQIHARDTALLKAHDELEARVRERTQALTEEIAERQRAEEHLVVARDAAEAASRAKSAFLANMSHELRTPLNAIIGYSELLLEEQAPGDPTGDDLRRICSSSQHLLQLINDVLDLSKIEADRMEVHHERVTVRGVLDGLASTIGPLAARNGNTLVIGGEDDASRICTDVLKLRQCLINTLSNACKFTHDGAVTLSVTHERRGDRAWVAFAVQDTGIGLGRDEIARIFEPFVQADSSTTRKYGGTGLGLSLTRRLCALLGGELHVESVPGQGSTFTVAVPAVPPSRGCDAEDDADGSPPDVRA